MKEKKNYISPRLLKAILDLACLVSDLRGSFDRDGEVTRENPERAFIVLRTVAFSRALMCGRDGISNEDMPILFGFALSLCPRRKALIVEKLFSSNVDGVTEREIENLLNLNSEHVGYFIHELKALGLIREIERISPNGRPINGFKLSCEFLELKRIINENLNN